MEVGDGAEGKRPSEGWKKTPESAGEKPVKRMMKSPYQLEILEKTYAVETYPSESLRAELSVKTGLTDRQLQMWFCHRRLKDRKFPPVKRSRREEASPPPPAAAEAAMQQAGGDMMVGSASGSGSGSSPSPSHLAEPRKGAAARAAGSRIGAEMSGAVGRKRYYEVAPLIAPPVPQLSMLEMRVIASVEAQLGERLREDGPILGVEFDPLPPGAFGAPIESDGPAVLSHRHPATHHFLDRLENSGQQKQHIRPYDGKIFERHDTKSMKASTFLHTAEPSFIPNSSSGKKKSGMGGTHLTHSHAGSRALQEYQFLPEQPSARADERTSQSHYYDSSADIHSRASSLASGGQSMRGNEQVAPSYTFQGHMSSSSLLSQQGRQQMLSSGSTEYDNAQHHNSHTNSALDGQYGTHPVVGIENSYLTSERRAFRDEDVSRMERKRKSDEARIAKEVEAHEKRIRKELEKQDILRRKREEQMRREMERHDRERRKEEERLMREKQREEERFLREQRRENERREKILMKESLRAEKLRQKEEMRREKEAARLKAANERATARRIAREYTELVEDERLELMELATSSKGLPSIMALDFDTLQRLDEFRDMLSTFPPSSVCLKRPFSVKPWINSEENIGNLLMAWKFLITFGDVLKLWPFTLDEFVQALHDYDSRLLGEIHVALLKSIIKDIEDVARTPSMSLGTNQTSAANPGGGHPHMVEGAYSWGFDIRRWQRHLNFMTWPEILRQFALSAGFGPKLKKRNVEHAYFRDDHEGNDGEDIITNLRNGAAAENAVALMQEKGFTHRRRSRHRLTPGTVKFAAFHVLSLEGSKGLTILEVADKIQKSGLRDLTTSKTPEASIAAALSRDTKLFERTAPSTYCVRTPYRKDPADTDVILSAAREKIQVFQNVPSDSEEAEKDAEDAEREDDSECDGEDDAEVDDTGTEVEPNKNFLLPNEQKNAKANQLTNNVKREAFCDAVDPQRRLRDVQKHPSEKSKDLSVSCAPNGQCLDTDSNCHDEVNNLDQEDMEVDESNCEPWVQGLTEDEYCDLSVEERLNALVALIGVAIEGNSIRAILEERLEAASALKKQMWAEAQLDKRRIREEFTGRYSYSSAMGNKAEACQTNATTEGSPLHGVDNKGSDGNLDILNNNQFVDPHNLCNGNMSAERNLLGPEFSINTDILAPQPYGYAAEKSRSQLKSYIGHKAEEMYVYRSLPLGQDRRRNRYWLFSTSVSRNDPGSGRIFYESRDGFWKLIDSEEAFDALLASLDIRGLRESHLHSMLQKIEKAFKETIQKRKDCVDSVKPIGSLGKAGAAEVSSRSDSGRELGSPSSTLSGLNADPLEYSSSFRFDLGRDEDERNAALRRYQGFLRWMWQESYNPSILYAMKYGKKRCSELLQTCQSCYQSYFAEERHCSSCHKTFKILHNADTNFSEHVVLCEEKRMKDPDWKMVLSDSTPIRIRLLKAQLSLIEVSIPAEALQPFWTEGYRKSWGVKLHSSSSAEELFQVLTLLEAAIIHDCLSSSFETTKELLSGVPSLAAKNSASLSGPAPVLPWVPDTTAAVALRLLDLDASIAYMVEQKLGFHKDKEAAELIKLPSRYNVAKNTQELDPRCPQDLIDYQEEAMWLDNVNGRRSRGRGIRGSRPTARGRGRGRGLRGIGSSTRMEFKVRGTLGTYVRTARKYTRRGGKVRGARGRQRGRRTPRPRQRPEGRVPVVKVTLSDHFNTGTSSIKRDKIVEPPVSMSRQRWGLGGGKRSSYLAEAEDNSIGSESEDQAQPSEDEYDDQAMDFTREYNHNEPTGLMDDESEEDGDGEGDGEEEAEDEDDVVQEGQEEMDEVEDEEMGDEYGDEVGDDDVNGEEEEEDDEAPLSFSSDYSSS
ncbi:WHIM1 domain-containing protein [Dioscorea alata]|uniref:WHIM1 domain-containing protein n=1 Tax=Dioscorea alata TaxID=55571 RepID=A0ACB7WE46_DIOAL|nr:WHIM1 domain-containing protein [Dioscorea alata]